MKLPDSEFRDSRLWLALEEIVAELNATGEIVVNTGPDYIVAYICRELAAKRLVSDESVQCRIDETP